VRLSVLEDDPGWPGHYPIADVFVDGKPVFHCVTADEELGIAICAALDSDGNVMITSDGEEVLYMERHGEVEIVWRPRLEDVV
jgi:hypothetical protein